MKVLSACKYCDFRQRFYVYLQYLSRLRTLKSSMARRFRASWADYRPSGAWSCQLVNCHTHSAMTGYFLQWGTGMSNLHEWLNDLFRPAEAGFIPTWLQGGQRSSAEMCSSQEQQVNDIIPNGVDIGENLSQSARSGTPISFRQKQLLRL